MHFSHIIGQSPRDWERIMHQNVVLTIFHTQNIYQHGRKNVRTTLQCIVGLQLQREGHKMGKKKTLEQICPIVSLHFQTFSLGLEITKHQSVVLRVFHSW